jgi:hypothetical protein
MGVFNLRRKNLKFQELTLGHASTSGSSSAPIHVPVPVPATPGIESSKPKRAMSPLLLNDAIREYLSETKNHKSEKTYAAYRTTCTSSALVPTRTIPPQRCPAGLRTSPSQKLLVRISPITKSFWRSVAAVHGLSEIGLLLFLLCTGAQEQEAQFVYWTDVDLEQKTNTVTEHLNLGSRLKGREEGSLLPAICW